jgi:hypothetical protein
VIATFATRREVTLTPRAECQYSPGHKWRPQPAVSRYCGQFNEATTWWVCIGGATRETRASFLRTTKRRPRHGSRRGPSNRHSAAAQEQEVPAPRGFRTSAALNPRKRRHFASNRSRNRSSVLRPPGTLTHPGAFFCAKLSAAAFLVLTALRLFPSCAPQANVLGEAHGFVRLGSYAEGVTLRSPGFDA